MKCPRCGRDSRELNTVGDSPQRVCFLCFRDGRPEKAPVIRESPVQPESLPPLEGNQVPF